MHARTHACNYIPQKTISHVVTYVMGIVRN